ncbi:hypothetical protein D3C81_2064370 [compost metagenome]
MNESPLHRRRISQFVQQPIHHVVTDEGTCGLRNRCRNTSAAHGRHHGFDRQCAEPRRRAIGHNRFIYRLLATVIRNTRIVHVDGNAFNGDVCTTSGLTDRQHQRR